MIETKEIAVYRFQHVNKYILLFLIFSLSSRLAADSALIIKDPNSYLHYRISLNSKELYKEQKNGVWENQGKLSFSNIDFKDFKNYNNQTFEIKGAFLISIDGSGQLYKLNLKEHSFTRIDNTYYSGYNFNAIKFIRRDTLFSFGGSGFWHHNNIETFFSTKTKEWELLNAPGEDNPKQILGLLGGYDKNRDIISVIESLPQFYKPKNEFSLKYYEKNIKSNEWKFLGYLNSKLLFKLGAKSLKSIFINGVYFFQDGDFLIIGDPKENKILILKKNLLLNFLGEISENRGLLYSYEKVSNNIDSKIKVDSISFQKLKSLGVVEGEFYIKNNNNQMILFAILVFTIALFSIIFFPVYNKKHIQKNQIEKSKNNKEEFPLGVHEFLSNCFDYPIGAEFNSQKINELIGIGTYSYESQRQLRSRFINSLNNYFKFYHNMEGVLLRKNSNEDKRMSIYYISEEYYEKLKILIKNHPNNKI